MSVPPEYIPNAIDRGVRCGLVVVGLALWIATQALLGAREFPVDARTQESASVALTEGDRVHEWMGSWHGYLQQNRSATSALLMVSSALVDLVACWMFAATIFGRTVRPFLGLLILFSLRQLCQWVSPLPAPVGMLWYDPGFPSLLVTYEVANDFFFSGHTGIAVLGGIELARRFGRVGLILGMLLGLFEILTVLVLRAHYTMDVFAGAVVAILAAVAATRLAAHLDAGVRRLATGRKST
ncbi:MAG: hypothetical protein CMJ65_13220 [Planctomycetaceae bacterium]|jgi:membrane-associated phospholipid phosphatase|nr:hypothetical protein [Planctomycetaceae bacterium]MDP7277049.1 phosphatase PAP2-related protein [Planctomycetaceae bacterium]